MRIVLGRSLAVALLAAAMLLLVATGARGGSPSDARAFVDSIGVDLHLSFTPDTAYTDYDRVKARMQELGVRHVRDVLIENTWNSRAAYDRWNDLAANGIRTLFSIPRVPVQCCGRSLADLLYALKYEVGSAAEAVEGPNEYDGSGDSNWAANLRAYQQDLYNRVKADPSLSPLPVVAPSLRMSSSPAALGYIGSSTDRSNTHPYPGGQPPHMCNYGRTLDGCLADAWYNTGGQAVWATETGYHDATNCKLTKPSGSGGCSGHHPTASEATAIYLPRLYLEYFRRGVERSYLYELADQKRDACYCNSEQHFGLVRNDFSPKPQFDALERTIGFLDGPAASTLDPLGYTLSNTADPDGSGPRGAVRDVLLEKADGTWWLALWQDSWVWDRDRRRMIDNPATAVQVTLDRVASSVTGYRPTQGSGASYRIGPSDLFTVAVDDDVLLLEIAP